MALIGVSVLFAIMLLFGMCTGYLVGSIFDRVMDTNITPIMSVGTLILSMNSDLSNSEDSKPIEKIYKLIGMVIILPPIALLGSFIADMVFPQTAQAFMDMISYKGSIYGLAFFGSLAMSVVKIAIALIIIWLLLPLRASFSRQPRA